MGRLGRQAPERYSVAQDGFRIGFAMQYQVAADRCTESTLGQVQVILSVQNDVSS